MKKNILIIVVLLIDSICVYAQPVLNSTDFPSNYSADVYSISPVGLSLGNAGADQVWDFSTLALPDTRIGTYEVIPVSASLQPELWNTANFCVKKDYVYEMSPKTNIRYTYTMYFMYQISATSIDFLGDDSLVWGAYGCYDTRTYFQFPYTYGKIINDTYDCGHLTPIPSVSTYDAYGTLITPFGTYTDVIRKRSGSGEYTWFKTNPFTIIMEFDFSTGGGDLYVYKNTTPLSVNEIDKEGFLTVYPNPTNSVINIQIANTAVIDKVIINDLTGKTVLEQFQNNNQVSVKNLVSGIYVLNVVSGNKNYYYKFIKE